MGAILIREYSLSVRALVIGLALVVGATSLVGSAVGAERFKRHAVRGQGMSLEVPASWVAVDASLPSATITQLGRENPKLAPFISQLGGPNSPAKFLALDASLRGGFATNVNVAVVPVPSITFAQYRTALASEIRSIVGSAPIDARSVTIAGARAVRLSYKLQIRFGRTVVVQTLQYGFLRPGRSVVVTYTTLPGLKSQFAQTFARSAASIRFS